MNLRLPLLKQIVSYTNPYYEALLASLYLEEFVRNLLQGNSLISSYYSVQQILPIIWKNINFDMKVLDILWQLLENEIWTFSREEIKASHHIVESLEALIWVLTQTNSYIDAVLQAVNLGGDTASIGALTGAIAGILYTEKNIPNDWFDKLLLFEQVERLIITFNSC